MKKGSDRFDAIMHGKEVGKLQAGEIGLKGFRRNLEKLLDLKVDLSVIKKGGKFDQGPFIQLKK